MSRPAAGSWVCCVNDDTSPQAEPKIAPPDIERSPIHTARGDKDEEASRTDMSAVSLLPWEPQEFSQEAFLRELENGVELIKHDRQGHARHRVLFTVDHGRHIFWRDPISALPLLGNAASSYAERSQAELRASTATPLHQRTMSAGGSSLFTPVAERVRSSKDVGRELLKLRPELPTSELLKVNHGTDPDPAAPELCGNAVLRSSCPEEDLPRSFSLVYPDRTLDLTASCEAHCDFLMRGFRSLLQDQRRSVRMSRAPLRESVTQS